MAHNEYNLLLKLHKYNVKPFMDTVQWQNGQDFCPDMLYLESKKAF
jgi:hypothetical protein